MAIGVSRREDRGPPAELFAIGELARDGHPAGEPARGIRVCRDRHVPAIGRGLRAADVIAVVVREHDGRKRPASRGIRGQHLIEHILLVRVWRSRIDDQLWPPVGSDQVRIGVGRGRQRGRTQRKHANPRTDLGDLRYTTQFGGGDELRTCSYRASIGCRS